MYIVKEVATEGQALRDLDFIHLRRATKKGRRLTPAPTELSLCLHSYASPHFYPRLTLHSLYPFYLCSPHLDTPHPDFIQDSAHKTLNH